MTKNMQAQPLYARGVAEIQQNNWTGALPFLAAAMQYDSRNVRYALFLGSALWHTGRRTDAIQLWSLGADHDPMLRIAQYQQQADPLTRQLSNLADTELRRYMTQLQSDTVKQLGMAKAGRIATALWPQTHFGRVDYDDNGPRPYMFYAPDLPRSPIFEREGADWTKNLESHANTIRDEFLSLMRSGQEVGKPYVEQDSFAGAQWKPLKGQHDWSAVHLFSDGKPTEFTSACPNTCNALKDVPLVYHGDNPMEVFFSVLKPGTHIPPHYGLANCRVTVHMPLIIPEKCAIRVGDHEHVWQVGETFIFDDSYDHEAWNRSGETRVVLIFEAWRPDMTEGEIAAVNASYRTRQHWLDNRKMPDLKTLIGAT